MYKISCAYRDFSKIIKKLNYFQIKVKTPTCARFQRVTKEGIKYGRMEIIRCNCTQIKYWMTG